MNATVQPLSHRPAPPGFTAAKNRRQKARAAGLHPDYWYPVAWERELAKGKVMEVCFWKRSIALFQGDDGEVRAVENRCAHRQLKLSAGLVDGCNVVCPYHGWAYDGNGKLVSVPHDLFGKPMPNIQLTSFPVQRRYGIVWLFPGDPGLATKRALPDIPELEGPRRWASVPVDFVWPAHHSMIIDNVSDFSHAFLHRRYRPFTDAKLTSLDADGERVKLSYDTKVGRGRFSQYFVNRRQVDTNAMKLCYEYPYQWSNTDDKIKHWCFILPIDESHSRAFFLFYFKSLKIPLLPLNIPHWLMHGVMQVAKRVLVKPLLAEDGMALTLEQAGYNEHYEAPIAELNPAVHQFQRLTIDKWQSYLDTLDHRGRRQQAGSLPVMASESAAT